SACRCILTFRPSASSVSSDRIVRPDGQPNTTVESALKQHSQRANRAPATRGETPRDGPTPLRSHSRTFPLVAVGGPCPVLDRELNFLSLGGRCLAPNRVQGLPLGFGRASLSRPGPHAGGKELVDRPAYFVVHRRKLRLAGSLGSAIRDTWRKCCAPSV